MATNSPVIFSFFAGAGFLDLGFEDSGYEIAYVNEYHEPFLSAYKYSRYKMGYPNPRFGYEKRSIESINRKQIKTYLNIIKNEGNLVGFIGGPPCPDFSVGGKNLGKEGKNGLLSSTYVNSIIDVKPDFFLFENVKGLYRTKKHRSFFESLKNKLSIAGYALHERLINSIEYGAPQDRDRIILIGFKSDISVKSFDWIGRIYPDRSAFDFKWPKTEPFRENGHLIFSKKAPKELTIQYWFDRNDVLNHPNATHCFKPRAGLSRFLIIDEGDDSKKSYKRLHRWRYSPTAAYGNNEVHLHPYKPRRISVAEALAIQSLPLIFSLPPEMTLSNMFKTVGNGVPYLASLGLAKSILNHLGIEYAINSREFSTCNWKTTA